MFRGSPGHLKIRFMEDLRTIYGWFMDDLWRIYRGNRRIYGSHTMPCHAELFFFYPQSGRLASQRVTVHQNVLCIRPLSPQEGCTHMFLSYRLGWKIVNNKTQKKTWEKKLWELIAKWVQEFILGLQRYRYRSRFHLSWTTWDDSPMTTADPNLGFPIGMTARGSQIPCFAGTLDDKITVI